MPRVELGAGVERCGREERRIEMSGPYMGLGIALGVAIGAVVGVVTDNIGTWLALGLVLGIGSGAFLDSVRGRRG
jgi:hypothetical protein